MQQTSSQRSRTKLMKKNCARTATNSENTWRVTPVRLKGRVMFHMELNEEYFDIVRTKDEAMRIMKDMK